MASMSSTPITVANTASVTINPVANIGSVTRNPSGIPLRSAYSWTVHAYLFLSTLTAAIILMREAVAVDGSTSNLHPHNSHLIVRLAVPYVTGFLIYFAIPRANMLGCAISLVYDEVNIILGFALVISIYTNFSDTKYMFYMIFWFSVAEIVRIAYLVINQFCEFVGSEKPIPF